MSNRVEELESQVAELQAAVDGLTEELVETRERLRKLEDDAEPADGSAGSERVTPAESEDRTTADEDDHDAEADAESETEPDGEADGDEDSSSGTDEIIVA